MYLFMEYYLMRNFSTVSEKQNTLLTEIDQNIFLINNKVLLIKKKYI